MSRTTIDFGIDLGTTNSAIAVLRGADTEIIKDNDGADITSSAVFITSRGKSKSGFGQKIDWKTKNQPMTFILNLND